MPLYPSLHHSPVLDKNFSYESSITKNTSGEMTMDKLIVVLDPNMELPQPNTFVNIVCCKAQRKSKKQNKSVAAWKMNIEETIKHVPPILLPTAKAQLVADNDELTVEELLAFEDRVGTAAWVDKSEGIGQTMKHVGSNGQENKDACFNSISKSKSVGKGMECISLSAEWRSQGYRKQQVQCARELFLPEHGAKEHGEEQVEAEALELEQT
ncbi:hypothetical protein C0995_008701 [Termitomyces sp. Mi166|nr:hypothetical protein C0995_008701 [Termitomyces sp. Mi166\